MRLIERRHPATVRSLKRSASFSAVERIPVSPFSVLRLRPFGHNTTKRYGLQGASTIHCSDQPLSRKILSMLLRNYARGGSSPSQFTASCLPLGEHCD